MDEDYDPFGTEERNPFDDENVSNRAKLFTLALIILIIITIIAYGVVHYQIFDRHDISEYQKSSPIDIVIVPHNADPPVNETPYDMIVKVRINAYY